MTEALAVKQELSSAIEQVVIDGDLSKLSADQRLSYYKTVCESVGLNPYTRPFDYIRLNGKLTLYARKDATDQLRKLNGVNIDDVKMDDDGDWFIVTVKGSDKSGRRDVEMGCVNKKDMQGNLGNAMMKAVTKAKRRLTLSLCGLGWLDETEVETIPTAQPVIVDDAGNIAGNPVEARRIESKPVEAQTPINNNTPVAQNAPEAQESAKFDEVEFLRNWKHRSDLPSMTLAEACQIKDGKGKEYGTHSVERLFYMMNAIQKKLPTIKDLDTKDMYMMKLSAINEILTAKANAQAQMDSTQDPHIKKEDEDAE